MRLRFLVVIAFLLSGSVALGDGCYMPEHAVRKIPDIIAQHAVLSWRDGVETLVIRPPSIPRLKSSAGLSRCQQSRLRWRRRPPVD